MILNQVAKTGRRQKKCSKCAQRCIAVKYICCLYVFFVSLAFHHHNIWTVTPVKCNKTVRDYHVYLMASCSRSAGDKQALHDPLFKRQKHFLSIKKTYNALFRRSRKNNAVPTSRPSRTLKWRKIRRRGAHLYSKQALSREISYLFKIYVIFWCHSCSFVTYIDNSWIDNCTMYQHNDNTNLWGID